jgi:capsular polysaccharide biosynthesis protein
VTVSQRASRVVPELASADGDVTATDGLSAADLAAGLTSLGFVGAALRRRARLWCAIAVAGLLVGLGLYVGFPPAYQASTTILLTQMPGSSGAVPLLKPSDVMQDDIAMLQSRTVAERTMRALGLQQSVESFLAAESVTPVTDRVLSLTVSAPSSGEAVRRANALAAAFLQFRAEQLQAQQNSVLGALNQQITQSQQRIASLAGQIASLSRQQTTPSRHAKLKTLQTEHDQALTALAQSEQSTDAYRATTRLATASMVQGSEVLDDATPLRHSSIKHAGLYTIAGLGGGFALGVVLVIVRELASDRMRRREDVSRALGAPVRLSVQSRPPRRWRPGGRRGLAAARGDDTRRIVAHLRGSLPASSRGTAALAVVAVDNVQAAALPLVSLALSCAQDGRQVVMADLSDGSHAARLVGSGDPGVRPVSVDGASLVVAVPDRDDVMPAGPLHHGSPRAQTVPGDKALAGACASADLLLTLLTLDPSLGGDHLATWATDAVVVVTAGRSSWAKLHAVGEMVRLAGTRLVSVVLVGADNTDESLGTAQTPNPPDDVVYWRTGQVLRRAYPQPVEADAAGVPVVRIHHRTGRLRTGRLHAAKPAHPQRDRPADREVTATSPASSSRRTCSPLRYGNDAVNGLSARKRPRRGQRANYVSAHGRRPVLAAGPDKLLTPAGRS